MSRFFMLSCLIFKSSVDRGIPSLAAAPRRVRQRKSANVFELADVRRDGASYRLVQRGYR